MKVLLIGGTGIISTAVSAQLRAAGHELYLLNRGNRAARCPEGAKTLSADARDEEAARRLLEGYTFDVVADFIAFEPEHVKRDFRLFREKTGQYIFISSASAYQKPPVNPVITESTPLSNPYWQYARNKIACEEWLTERFRAEGFPVTIVRPSHTYDNTYVPLALHGDGGPWQVLSRMLRGRPVIIHGDGSSLWTVTHNSDFARGFIGLMGNPHAIGQTVHITGDESLTWTQIHEIIAARLGVRLNPLCVPSGLIIQAGKRHGYDFEGTLLGDKACSVIFDNTKLKRLVPGFAAATRFDQGMAETIPRLLSHPELQTEDPEFEAFCDHVCAAMGAARAAL
ncbi:MAG: SDR family oxidoreductase [Oscillospiraceae bacterium]|jgi:nucleoside-diphosphate-sugar epimerase|nr:SDR family oxidoreductase [Oscillospiraceae bacterium]